MIHKQPSPVPGCIRVNFELPSCIWADRIALVGDFNKWDQHATPLKQERDGIWRAVLDLAAGQRFAFCYLVDGNWQTDTNADGFVGSWPGQECSVVDTSTNALPLRTREQQRTPLAVAVPA